VSAPPGLFHVSTACAQCVFTPDSAAVRGSFITRANAIPKANQRGCLDSLAQGCGAAYESVTTCTNATCDSNPERKSDLSAERAACHQAAMQNSCAPLMRQFSEKCGAGGLVDKRVCFPPSNDEGRYEITLPGLPDGRAAPNALKRPHDGSGQHETGNFDDLGLPNQNGHVVVTAIRSWSLVPILVFTARTAEQQRILAFEPGADDSVVKPFSGIVLLDPADAGRATDPISIAYRLPRLRRNQGAYQKWAACRIVRFRLPKGVVLGGTGRWLCFEMSAVLRYFGPIAGIVYKELVSSAD
jgi:CheY-like chemotaxis protein